MRPIDADKAIKHFRKLSDMYSEFKQNEPDIDDKVFYRGKALAYSVAADTLEIAFGLDAITEIHSEWVRGVGNIYYCKNCGALLLAGSMKFCYECGAKMDNNGLLNVTLKEDL